MSEAYLDDAAIPIAQNWLKTCLDSHGSCRKSARHSSIFCTDNVHFINDIKGDGLVPSRLLKISPVSKTKDAIITVVKSDFLSQNTQYVALSHRWGLRETVCLTTDNFTQLSETGIPLNKLPRTFSDACRVTTGLGYSYLWIDSLCIIQDDRLDWKKEARRMAIVFDKAAVTIVAMDGLDCDAGLVVKDMPKHQRGVLESRAWVCQEQMISPRSLIFANESVQWECRECGASEHSLLLQQRHDASEPGRTPTHPKDIFVFFRDWRPRLLEGMEPRPPPTPYGSEDEEDDANVRDNHLDKSNMEGKQDIGQDENDESIVSSRREFSAEPKETDTSTDFVENEVAEGTSPPRQPTELLYGVTVRSQSVSPVMVDYSDLPGHAAHLREYWQFNDLEEGQTLKIYQDDDSHEPFGSFSKQVTYLALPDEAYYPFMKTWWQFMQLYSPRLLTYESDRFLAINGVTSVAQRWTHLRNTFGLWFHCLHNEICWYVDSSGPQAARPKEWLGPSWSWVSTCNGRVKNDVWDRLPIEPKLQMKPRVRTPVGTSFDLPLPFTAWMKEQYHSMELHSNLREAEVKTYRTSDGIVKHDISLQAWGRFSDEEYTVSTLGIMMRSTWIFQSTPTSTLYFNKWQVTGP
ncbi:hypothetical protein FOBRF1_007100 [Fusarium oxysporum]